MTLWSSSARLNIRWQIHHLDPVADMLDQFPERIFGGLIGPIPCGCAYKASRGSSGGGSANIREIARPGPGPHIRVILVVYHQHVCDQRQIAQIAGEHPHRIQRPRLGQNALA